MFDKNPFIVTRFKPGNKTLESIDETIRSSLKTIGLVGHRADDRVYPLDRNLWDNVCTYMIGCKSGIAVLEDTLAEDFSPNVALAKALFEFAGMKRTRTRIRRDLTIMAKASFPT